MCPGMRKPVSPIPISVRILVVEDVKTWRRFVHSTLANEKQWNVIAEVADGLEAVHEAQRLQPDLILLDIGLPGLNGVDAARRISQVAPKAKIVFVTQNTDTDVIRAALDTGAQGYVLKADAAKDLVFAIKAVLRGEKFVSRGLNL